MAIWNLAKMKMQKIMLKWNVTTIIEMVNMEGKMETVEGRIMVEVVADMEVGATKVPGSLPMMAFDCSKAFVYFYTFLIISNSPNYNQTVLRNSFALGI